VNHLVWRLHHRQVWFAGGALLVLTTLLAITGSVMAHDYHAFFSTCGATGSCGDAHALFRGDGSIIDLVDATVAVPLLMGLFWGAPLVAREYEEGTQDFAWTQGVSRRRWLGANLAWVFLAAAAWGGLLTALVGWWRFPENAVYGRFAAFDIQGVVPVAYALFAVALGVCAGSVFRRVLPAVAVTLGGFVALRAVIAVYLRPNFVPPVHANVPVAGAGSNGPAGSWLLTSQMVDRAGRPLQESIFALCGQKTPDGSGITGACVSAHGIRLAISYQPDTRFWAFQGIESAIYLVLAGALVFTAYRLVVHRDA
jgi:hypothetical protein